MKNFNKVITAILFFAVLFTNAQPPNPGGGVGGTTPGQQASPIDMYVYVLAIIAISMIVYFAKKFKIQKI